MSSTGRPAMRQPRMTTRRWIVASAIVALTFAWVQMTRRREIYRWLADDHARQERLSRQEAEQLRRSEPSVFAVARRLERGDTDAGGYSSGSRWGSYDTGKARTASHVDRIAQEILSHAGRSEAEADYHARMSRKYDQAAGHPWRWVPPDPPAPCPAVDAFRSNGTPGS